MQNVYISVNPFEKKMNVLFSQAEGDLSSVSIFPLPLNKGCYGGYCKYEEVFTSALTELLRINDIPEANISIAVPSGDVCFDFITIPNVGSARKNDDHYFAEISAMYPEIKKPEDISTSLVRNDKSFCVYRYSLFGAENYEIMNDFFMDTNHSMEFVTSCVIASGSLVSTFAGGGKGLFNRDNTYEFVNIRRKHTEIVLISENRIFAVNTVPFGTDALRDFSQSDFVDYRSFSRIDEAFSDFWHYYNAYRLHISELGLPAAKRSLFLAPKNYLQIGEYLTASSDLNWSLLELPAQYKPFADNLELIGLYLGKVPADFNFVVNEKPKSLLSK